MDKMLEGETYGDYTERFKNKGYSVKDLHNKATAAWFARRKESQKAKSTLSNEMVITITVEDFEKKSLPAKIQESVVLNIPQMTDCGPEFKFEMLESVVEQIMRTIKKELIPDEPVEIISDHI